MKKKNNKARKRQWTHAKNLMRKYEDCSYNGDFYCDHVYEPESPWVWVDFRFFHTTSKKYYAVAMTTAEFTELEKAESIVRESEPTVEYSKSRELWLAHESLLTEKLLKYLEHPITSNASLEIKDYGLPAIGIWAVIDAPFIDEHEIRKFIAFFRSLGQPSEPGFKWIGEEIQVDPKIIIRRNKIA